MTRSCPWSPPLTVSDPIVEMEGAQPLDENVGNTPRSRCQRNKLLLVASVAQGLGLFLCLTFFCLYRSAPQVQYPSIQSIRIQFTALPFSGCEKKFFRIASPDKAETMKVENDSIIINCDGFYLISLKGYFSQEVNVSLYFRKGYNPISIQSTNKVVNFITVVSLAFKDKVYLNMSAHDTSCLPVNGGELILVHQNPGGFCAH
ncbi:tumor necrosis factor ligand superfamily member 4 [Sciurus carolinensis]|uniref:tumor necrosis factor ligand superfamily member 4 n=1 Tax=Sciurus carolinensis TaxID=30640 RepID=UPI001FB341D0|nr:tumor necrosis factor ligand superfamily member 4 [Sciurus carolinensis]